MAAVATQVEVLSRQEVDTANKLTMIVFSGEMDRAIAAFNNATGAAASGMDVTMFFTFWGLQTIKKPARTGKSLMGRMLGWFLNDVDSLGPSKMNFGGAGRWMFKQMMKSHNATPVAELRALATDLGVKMLACQMSMDVMEIGREQMIKTVQGGDLIEATATDPGLLADIPAWCRSTGHDLVAIGRAEKIIRFAVRRARGGASGAGSSRGRSGAPL